MTSSVSTSDPVGGWAYVDWEDLSNLDRIATAFKVAENSVVLETTDGREVRITAWRNLSTGEYSSEYERRSVLRNGGREFRFWAHTPAYRRVTREDLETCLEAAVLEVDRVSVY
jgi:hypothetical protein